ncbi:hypothetical protein Tco_1355170 [Tanacetum coccineum]
MSCDYDGPESFRLEKSLWKSNHADRKQDESLQDLECVCSRLTVSSVNRRETFKEQWLILHGSRAVQDELHQFRNGLKFGELGRGYDFEAQFAPNGLENWHCLEWPTEGGWFMLSARRFVDPEIQKKCLPSEETTCMDLKHELQGPWCLACKLTAIFRADLSGNHDTRKSTLERQSYVALSAKGCAQVMVDDDTTSKIMALTYRRRNTLNGLSVAIAIHANPVQQSLTKQSHTRKLVSLVTEITLCYLVPSPPLRDLLILNEVAVCSSFLELLNPKCTIVAETLSRSYSISFDICQNIPSDILYYKLKMEILLEPAFKTQALGRIKREYSNARTPTSAKYGVAERKNRTLIEAARTMLADSFLPNTFWAEVNYQPMRSREHQKRTQKCTRSKKELIIVRMQVPQDNMDAGNSNMEAESYFRIFVTANMVFFYFNSQTAPSKEYKKRCLGCDEFEALMRVDFSASDSMFAVCAVFGFRCNLDWILRVQHGTDKLVTASRKVNARQADVGVVSGIKVGAARQKVCLACYVTTGWVLALETSKDAQAAEILKLKDPIKNLKRKCKPSISHHMAWLNSVKMLSMKKRLGRKEYVSKQGKKNAKPEPTLDAFDDLDVDGRDYIETEDVVKEGRQSYETKELNKGSGDKGGSTKELVSTAVPKTVSTARPELSTARPDVDAARQEDSVVEPRTPPTTTSIFDDEDITMAEYLIKIKKEKAKEKGVLIKDIKDSSRPARSTLTLKPLPTIDPKDKGKSVLEELEPAKKMTRKRERQREDEASKAAIAETYDEVQAGIDADALFAAKLQQEEREEYTIEERAKFLAETIAVQRKFRAAQRSAEIRSKPPTKSQLRNLMLRYLKNMGGYKHSQLKAKTFAEIQGLYERQKRVIDDFKPMDSDDAVKDSKEAAGVHNQKVLEEPNSTKVEIKQEGHEESIRKRPGRRFKMKATKKSKRQKTNADLEEEEQLKAFLKIVLEEEGIIDYEVLEKRFLIINWESKLYDFDRHRAECIYYRIFRFDGSFRTMFDANAEDELWRNQERWNLKSWDLYENCGVHTLILEDGTEIQMLAEKKYPLIKETLKRMLSLRLVAGTTSEDAYTLLRFIQKHIDEYGSHDEVSLDLSRLATTLNRLERSIQTGIYKSERVFTPLEFVPTNDEENIDDESKMDEEEDDDITKELYKDVNVNLESKDTDMTDADQGGADQHNVSQESGFEHEEEDAHVTLTVVHDTKKTEGLMQSSSVSSDFTDKLLNFENTSPADNEIASLMDSIVRYEEPSGQTSSLYTIPITVIPEITFTFTTTIPPPHPFFNPLPQQETPTPTPTNSEVTTSFPALPDFSSVFRFNESVTNLEKDLLEMKQVDQEEALANKREYLDLIDTSVRAIIKEEVNTQLPQILPQAVSEFATRSTYGAAASLSEFELTKILMDKMEEHKSYLRANYKKEIYDALVKSYNTEKDLFETYGEVFTLKKNQDNKDKDQGPSAGSDRGTKRRKSSKDAESSRDPKFKESKSTSSSKGTSLSQHKSSSKFAHAEETSHTVDDSGVQQNQEFNTGNNDEQPDDEGASKVDWYKKPKQPLTPDPDWIKRQHVDFRPSHTWISNIARAEKPPTLSDELMDTPINFSAFVLNQLNITNLTQELLVGLAFNLLKGTYKSRTELEYHFEECFKATSERLDWHNPEGKQYPFDLRQLIRRIHQLDTTYRPFYSEQRIDLYSLNNVSVLANNMATYEEYELNNTVTRNLEELWSDNWVPYQLCDHICEPYRFKNGITKWPTYSSDIDGFCNGGELPGMVRIGNMTYFQDHKCYEELADGKLKEETLMHKAKVEESWGNATPGVMKFYAWLINSFGNFHELDYNVLVKLQECWWKINAH